MKTTKRQSMTTATSRRQSANASASTPPPPSSSRRTSSATKPKGPTLATAARSRRDHSASVPPPSTKPPPARRRSSHHVASTDPKASLVHDAVRRAFHATESSDNPTDNAVECERLRDELVRVMADHQRQADEIVALRALARSLKEEVEAMQATQDHDHGDSSRKRPLHVGHEFFQLDAQVDALHEENALLRTRIEIVEREKRELEDVLDREIPRCELLAVQARAELESTASQLRDEQQENDRLRKQLAYYKARSRSPVRTQRTELLSGWSDSPDKENNRVRMNVPSPRDPTDFDETLRESLMSSVASFSMSAASAFSSQLQDDVETLKSELRRLHRSIDASVLSARGGRSRRTPPVERDQNEETAEA